jgi:hypothetical protein
MPARSAAYQFGFALADALSSTKQAAGAQLNTPAPATSGRAARSATPTNHFRVEPKPKPTPAAPQPDTPVYKSGPTARSATPTNHFRIERKPKPFKSAADIFQATPGPKKTPPAGGMINNMSQMASGVKKTPPAGGMLGATKRPTATMTAPPAGSKPAPRPSILEGSPSSTGSPNPGSQNEAFPPMPKNPPAGLPQINRALARYDATSMPIPQPSPGQIDVGAMAQPNTPYNAGADIAKMFPEQGMMDYMGPAPEVVDPTGLLGNENTAARLVSKSNLRKHQAGTYKGSWEGNDMGTPAPSPSPATFAARAARPF